MRCENITGSSDINCIYILLSEAVNIAVASCRVHNANSLLPYLSLHVFIYSVLKGATSNTHTDCASGRLTTADFNKKTDI